MRKEDGIKETHDCTITCMEGIIYGDKIYRKASFLSVVIPVLSGADAFHGSQGMNRIPRNFLTLPDSLVLSSQLWQEISKKSAKK